MPWGRSHFIDYVRAGGPLPALRIGRQPYGILPVSSLAHWQPSPSDTREGGVVTVLRNMRACWLEHSFGANVPRLGYSTDPVQDLQDVLHTDALSAGHRVRNVYGDTYVMNLGSFLRGILDGSSGPNSGKWGRAACRTS